MKDVKQMIPTNLEIEMAIRKVVGLRKECFSIQAVTVVTGHASSDVNPTTETLTLNSDIEAGMRNFIADWDRVWRTAENKHESEPKC